jgi:hypothetical protein
VHEQLALLLGALDRHEAHVGPGCSLADGGSEATSSSCLERGRLGRTGAGLPVASTPCTAKTFFARSMPTDTMVMGLPLPQKRVS